MEISLTQNSSEELDPTLHLKLNDHIDWTKQFTPPKNDKNYLSLAQGLPSENLQIYYTDIIASVSQEEGDKGDRTELPVTTSCRALPTQSTQPSLLLAMHRGSQASYALYLP